MKDRPGPTPIERQIVDVIRLIRREALISTAVFASVTGLFAIVVYSLQSKNAGEFASVFGVAVIVAGACVFVGGLVGFIFGIPRVPQQAPQAQTNEAKPEETAEDQPRSAVYQQNTNLEQLSDWLAKILVGVGLTQISTVPEHLDRLAVALQPGLGNFPNSKVFALGTVVYFTLAGFMLSYLMTRLHLARAFRHADIGQKTVDRVYQRVETTLEKRSNVDFKAIVAAGERLGRNFALTSSATSLDQEELNKLVGQASEATKGLIFRDAASFRDATWRDPDTTGRTIPIFLALIESGIKEEHSLYANLGVAYKDSQASLPERNREYQRAIHYLTLAIDTRGDYRQHNHVWYEFIRAQCHILEQRSSNQPPCLEDKKRVLDDLSVALEGLRDRIQGDNEVILRWLRDNRRAEQAAREDERVVGEWLKKNHIDPEGSTRTHPRVLRAREPMAEDGVGVSTTS